MSTSPTKHTETKEPWYKKLQKRWGVNSVTQVVIILIVFALTGTTIARLNGPLAHWVGITDENPTWHRWAFSILVVLPLYQLVLLAYGTLFGQWRFFWNFEKRMMRRLAFWRKRPKTDDIQNHGSE